MYKDTGILFNCTCVNNDAHKCIDLTVNERKRFTCNNEKTVYIPKTNIEYSDVSIKLIL